MEGRGGRKPCGKAQGRAKRNQRKVRMTGGQIRRERITSSKGTKGFDKKVVEKTRHALKCKKEGKRLSRLKKGKKSQIY